MSLHFYYNACQKNDSHKLMNIMLWYHSAKIEFRWHKNCMIKTFFLLKLNAQLPQKILKSDFSPTVYKLVSRYYFNCKNVVLN